MVAVSNQAFQGFGRVAITLSKFYQRCREIISLALAVSKKQRRTLEETYLEKRCKAEGCQNNVDGNRVGLQRIHILQKPVETLLSWMGC